MHEVCFGGFHRCFSVIVSGLGNAGGNVCREVKNGVSAGGRRNEDFFLQFFIQRTEYFYIGYVYGLIQRKSVCVFIFFQDLCIIDGGNSDPAPLPGDNGSVAGGSGGGVYGSAVFAGGDFEGRKKNPLTVPYG